MLLSLPGPSIWFGCASSLCVSDLHISGHFWFVAMRVFFVPGPLGIIPPNRTAKNAAKRGVGS